MYFKLSLALVILKAVDINGFSILSQKPVDFWDDVESFGVTAPSQDLRLPDTIVPSFYRLKLIVDLDTSKYIGDVFITINAKKPVKEIVLHAKDLNISNNTKLTEQIYEKIEITHKSKRQVNGTETASNQTEPALTGSSSNSTSQAPATEAVTPTNNTATSAKEVTTITDSVINNTTPSTTSSNELLSSPTESTTAFTPQSNNSQENVIAPSTPTAETNIQTILPKHATKPIDTQVTHSTVKNIKISGVTQKSGDQLVIQLGYELKPGVDYTLQLSFSGNISDGLTGFYKSKYVNRNNETKTLAVTQFQPISARAAFPCFDEPQFKAKFEISIAHSKNLTALSNMKVTTTEDYSENPNWQWTHFERSVSMSTYLVAYILSDFESIQLNYTNKDSVIPIKVWTRPEQVQNGNYALSIMPKLLEYYEELFGTPYQLDKLDLVAIPDFSTGAMENWGLLTFREAALIVNETDSTPRIKQNVALTVSHELAHQWFGNLVTMKWWTDLWLNEGFASYVEYLGADMIEPKWDMFESLSRDKMNLFRTDAFKTTQPVSKEVIDASEISQKFDEISYSKGANLIRMLNYTISQKLFNSGLVIYLDDWKYSNAEENDLWKAMSKATQSDSKLKDVSIVNFMNSWTRQAGYPVVSAKRNYKTGEILFEQKLFTSAKDVSQSMADQLWQIPVTFTPISATKWNYDTQVWLRQRSAAIKTSISSKDALYVNLDAIGYYRVNYDPENWELLAESLNNRLVKSPTARAQLIDDAFNLAKFTQLNYSYALELTSFVENGEESRMVWDVLLNNMGYIRHNLNGRSGYRYLQDFIKKLLKNELIRINYGLDLNQSEDDNMALHIENIVSWECYVESHRCMTWSQQLFDKWMNQSDYNNNPIPAHVRSIVYRTALREGGRREFDFMWNIFKTSTDPNILNLLPPSLLSTKHESLITMMLESSLTDEIPKQFAPALWNYDSRVGMDVAFKFLISNWDRVYKRFMLLDAFSIQNMLEGAFSGITTQADLDILKSFASKHKEQLLPMSHTLQKLIESANNRIRWISRHATEVELWFKNCLEGGPKTGNKTTEIPQSDAPAPSTPILNAAENSTSSNSTAKSSTEDNTAKEVKESQATQSPMKSTQNSTNEAGSSTGVTSSSTSVTSSSTNVTSSTTNEIPSSVNETSSSTNGASSAANVTPSSANLTSSSANVPPSSANSSTAAP